MASLGRTAHPEQREYPVHHDGRARVLIETADPALLISDFRFLGDDGFDVALCAGPGRDAPCPLLEGGECELVRAADVVVHALDPGLRVAAAIKAARPDLPVLVERHRRRHGRTTPVPDGCVPLDMPCSLEGQSEALRRAVRR